MLSEPRRFSWLPRVYRIRPSASGLICRGKSSRNGDGAFSMSDSRVLTTALDAVVRTLFPPEVVVQVKAIACELPKELGLPFSRISLADIAAAAIGRGIVASISGTTVWRWLSADAIKPWSHRSWISVRDPDFAAKAARVLDLYQGVWESEPLTEDDYVLSSDEKTSIQSRGRASAGATAPGRLRRVESDYKRNGALAYLAAWDVRRAKVFGQCASTTGIDTFRRLADLVMRQEPYKSARRVFWVVDNGSSHRGASSVERLAQWYPNAIMVHTPVHASWLNQIEIYFSIVQRKVLTPNEFESLAEVEARLMDFQKYYEQTAGSFEWKFTRDDLRRLLDKLSVGEPARLRPPAA